MIVEKDHIDNITSGCIKGNRLAQEQLYKNFYKVLVTICIRYTKNEDDAIEVLNNGFLKIFKNIHKYQPQQATLYTWMRTIMINSCLNFIKTKEKNVQHMALTEAVDSHTAEIAIPLLSLKDLIALCRQLPPATQAVFNLYAVEGYNHKEIAEALGISAGTSKWHLSEARKKMQLFIKTEELKAHG